MRKYKTYFLLIIFYSFWISAGKAQTVSDAAATGISRAFNPAISANCLFDGMASNRSSPLLEEWGLKTGLHYQEICLEMTSNVDVYLQSKIAIAAEEENGLEIEEAYLTTLRMPIPVIIRGGLMLNTFGRHNLYHLHHMAFAEPPMILEQVFGPDLNEMSIEASYLVPLDWYSDMTVGFLNGNNKNLFNSDANNDFAYLFHLDNMWDVSDEVSLRLGGSYLTGNRGRYYAGENRSVIGSDTSRIFSQIWGIDCHLKWKPLEYGRYRSFTLQGEYINARLNFDGQLTKPLHGFFLQTLGQVGLMWWLQARYDWFSRSKELQRFFSNPVNLKYNLEKDIYSQRISCSVAYVPTEFSAYRLQYNWIKLGSDTEQQILAQVNVTIGSHPAHKY